VLFASCSPKNEKDSTYHEISIFSNSLASLNSTQLVNEVSIIPLETNSENIIGGITKLIRTDDKYFILDAKSAKKIFVFSKEGDFLYSIGDLGKGPGEYLNIMDFSIDLIFNYILILDDERKILKTDLDGNFILEKAVPKECRSLTNIEAHNGEIFAYSGIQPVNEKKYQIIQFDKNLDPIKYFLPYEYPLPGLRRFTNALYTFEKRICFVSFYDNAIYEIRDEVMVKRYQFNFSGKELSLKGLTSENFIENSVNSFLFNNCVEGDDIVFLPIFDRGRPKYGFLTKKHNNFLLVERINQENPPFCIPISCYKNIFISTIESQVFEQYFPESSFKPGAMDNPIIVEYKMSFKNER
jgi:hypothetical protein